MIVFLIIWSISWFYVKRVLAATAPILIAVLSGAFGVALDALRAYWDNTHAFTWGSFWTIGGTAFIGYIVSKALHADKTDWIKFFLSIADVFMTPKEALHEAIAQVKPLTPVTKIEQKVLPDSPSSNPQG